MSCLAALTSSGPHGLLALAIALSALGCRGRDAGDPPAFEILEADDLVALARDTGRPVVASLWATWCEPCIEEMAPLTRFAAAHPDFIVVGLATDDPDAPGVRQRLDRILASARPGYRQARLRPGGESRFLEAFGHTWDGMLPKLVVLGPDGKPRLVLDEAVDDDALERRVAPLVGTSR